MSLGEDQVEKGWVSIKLETRADDSNVSGPVPLEWELVREMALVDEYTTVRDTFSLESTELKGHIGGVLQDHIASCGDTCDIFKVFAHQTVSTTRVGCVAHIKLTRGARSVTRLLAKKVVFLCMVLVNVF